MEVMKTSENTLSKVLCIHENILRSWVICWDNVVRFANFYGFAVRHMIFYLLSWSHNITASHIFLLFKDSENCTDHSSEMLLLVPQFLPLLIINNILIWCFVLLQSLQVHMQTVGANTGTFLFNTGKITISHYFS